MYSRFRSISVVVKSFTYTSLTLSPGHTRILCVHIRGPSSCKRPPTVQWLLHVEIDSVLFLSSVSRQRGVCQIRVSVVLSTADGSRTEIIKEKKERIR